MAMSKRYTFQEDHFIVSYFGIAPIWNDLGRSEASVRQRAKKLKECGAWEAIQRIEQAQKDYLACLGVDEVDQTIATMAR